MNKSNMFCLPTTMSAAQGGTDDAWGIQRQKGKIKKKTKTGSERGKCAEVGRRNDELDFLQRQQKKENNGCI